MKGFKFIICLLPLLYGIHCIVFMKPLGPPINRTYLADKAKLDEQFAKEKKYVNPAANYRPGLVKRTLLKELVRDPSGMLTVRNEFIIKLKPGRKEADFMQEIRRSGLNCVIVGIVPTFSFLQVRPIGNAAEFRKQVIKLESVAEVFAHYVRETNQHTITRKNEPFWHIKKYKIDKIWKRTQGAGVIIALLDSGLDTKSPHFKGRIRWPYSVITRSPVFEDGVYYKNRDVTRVIDHGTRVAGVAAGAGIKNKIHPGVAPKALVMPIQVLGFSVKQDQIFTNDLTIIEGIARALAFKANIINISLGADYSALLKNKKIARDPTERKRVFGMIRRHASWSKKLYNDPLRKCAALGVIVTVAAGNDGMDANLQPLASHNSTLTAGALTDTNRPASFSNRGPGVDSYMPGEAVYTVAPGGNFYFSSGTSFSAPFLAGVVALAKSIHPNQKHSTIKNALKKTNIRSRVTILPGKIYDTFDPVGFLEELNIFIPGILSTGAISKDFRNDFGLYFIEKGDTDKQKLKKILGYYNEGRARFSTYDEEARIATRLAPRLFSDIIGYSKDKGMGYPTARILAEAKLSAGQLKKLTPLYPKSDFIAIIFNWHDYKIALPLAYERLIKADWNINSLYFIHRHGGDEAYALVRNFVLKVQKTKYFSNNEAIALWVLTHTKTMKREEAIKLCLISFKQLRKKEKSNEYSPFVLSDEKRPLAEAFLRLGRKEGLRMAINVLQQIEKDHSESSRGLTRSELRKNWAFLETDLKAFQKLVNTYSELGVKYNYLSPAAERKNALKNLQMAAQKAVFRDGKFRSP